MYLYAFRWELADIEFAIEQTQFVEKTNLLVRNRFPN